MIRTVDLRGRTLSKAQYNLELPRATLNVAEAMVLIQPILDRVKNGTEADLIALAQEFDDVTPASIRVPQRALDEALSQLDPVIRRALELSISRVKKVHNDQVRSDTTITVVDGGTVTEKWVPVDRVGLYVPGGRAVYPSSVMMNVIPAQIAKVDCLTQQFLQPARSLALLRSMQLGEHKQLLCLLMAWMVCAKSLIL